MAEKEMHWHCEASLPACMPEWQETVRTALQAREALEWYATDEVEGFTLKVRGSDAMATIVASWDGKPDLLNVYAWDCSDSDCGPEEEES